MSTSTPTAWGLTIRSLALSLALIGSASAKEEINEQLTLIEDGAAEITAATDELEDDVAPGRGFITSAQATERFQDYVFLFMTKDYEAAAEGFFTLVTTAALSNAGLHRDAEWYLAESLFFMENLATAEARYQVIADDMQHPFRDDAVRRLLELYASSGQVQAFYALYEQEIVQGRVRPSDLITYAVAKAFYRSDDYPAARKNFEDLGPDSPFHGKALYFLGALEVAEGKLDTAIPFFQAATERSLETLEDQQVHDLSWLALGRIYYEQQRYPEAEESYNKIAGDSQFLADQLYELTWTFVKQEQFKEAGNSVEIFLLAYSDHQYAAQLKVLQGHLHMMQERHDEALTQYEQVIVEYTPIRKQFAELAVSNDDPAKYFERIIQLDESTGTPEGLPPFAVAMMLSDTDLSRSLTVYRELERQRRNVVISEGLIVELEEVLGSSAGIGGFDQLRYDVQLNQSLGKEFMLDLLQAEESYLSANGASSAKLGALEKKRKETSDLLTGAGQQREIREAEGQKRLQAVREDLEKVQEELRRLQQEEGGIRKDFVAREATLDPEEEAEIERRLADITEEIAAMTERAQELQDEENTIAQDAASDGLDQEVAKAILALRDEYKGARRGVSAADSRQVFDRIDGLWTALRHDQSRLVKLRNRIETTESSEMGRIRQKFNYEVREVAAQRELLDKTMLEAQEVSIGLTRAGFGRLEDFFAESVLKADMGVVDVYWAEKLDVADQKAKVQEEKAALMSDLEARFNLIRQKLNQ